MSKNGAKIKRMNRALAKPASKSKPLGGVKAVLFDLGKVILNFNFEPAFQRLALDTALAPQDIENYFMQSGLEVLYDGGKISSFAFHRRVKKALKHSLNFQQFKKIWNEIFTPNHAILRLIRHLKKSGYRLVLISNTNPMHFEYIRKKYPILMKFDRLIVSYKEKIRKPDERIYQKAIRACQAQPAEIFYIDDRSDLTEAASAIGLNVFTFKNNPKQLIRSMKEANIL